LQRNRWIPLAGIAFSLIVGTCVSVCLLAILFWQVASSLPASAPSETITIQQPTPDPTLLRRQPTDHERQTAEAIARAVIPDRDLPDLAHRLQGLSPDVQLQTSSQTPPAYEVGDTETFWLHNHGAKAFFTATATLQYETPHAYWWVEDGYHIPQTDLAQAAGTFENQTYPTNRRLFGSEWFPGIDSDPHIYIYLGNVPGVGGYFSGPDEFPTEIRPFSNQHEMFYINLENARPGNDYFDGILAHEYQHMIHWAIDRNEDTWVSEGLSELAAGINRYDVGGSDQLFLAAPDGHQDIDHDHHKTDDDHDVHEPRQFGIFPALGVSHGDADDTGCNHDIPEDGTDDTQFMAEKLGSQQLREIVKGDGQQTRRDKPEQHGIDVHGPHPSEMDVLDIRQEVGCNQISRADQSKGCRDGKPEGGCQGKRFSRRISGRYNFSHFIRQNENSF